MSLKDGTGDSEYVLYSLRSLRWGGDDSLREALKGNTYGVASIRGDLTLLKRGAAHDQNAKALQMIARRH
jgi:hypothetical protein